MEASTPDTKSLQGDQGVVRRLLEFEKQHDLFRLKIQGYPFWQTVRLKVFRSINERLGVSQRAHEPKVQRSGWVSTAERLLSLPRLLLTDNPLRSGRRDVVVLGHNRRKLEDDGLWWDIYCDPVLDQLDGSWAYISTYPGKPPGSLKTAEAYTLDLPRRIHSIKRVLGLDKPVRPTPDERSRLESLDHGLAAEFGVEPGLVGLVTDRLSARHRDLPIYTRFLEQTRPRLALLVVSYFHHDFVEACKRLDIPVVELQHGFLGPNHLGYSFPPDVHGEVASLFPDYFLSFGEYWNHRATLPIRPEKVITVGYPYFDLQQRHFKDVPTKKQVLFISQGAIGERLSKIAAKFARMKEIHGHEVVYKVHPGERRRWRTDYPWLQEAPLTVVEGDRPHLYRHFAESSVQVGSTSTALYEGLGFGLTTFLYDPHGFSTLDDLVELGMATYFEDAEQLADLIADKKTGTDPPALLGNRVFLAGSERNFEQAIEKILVANG